MSLEALDALLRGEPLLALFVVVAAGLALGAVSVRGVRLGSSGVLFAGLLAGHLGYRVPETVGPLGLVLFVYCVGVSAGVRFFSSLARHGAAYAKLALCVVGVGGATTAVGGTLLGLAPELAAGLFAGALTSTPALAAAVEGLEGPAAEAVSIGYGIGYPCGVVGVVLFVQVWPRLLRVDLDAAAAHHAADERDEALVETVLVEVTNPNLFGKRIAEAGITHFNACQVSRILRADRLEPLRYDDEFEAEQVLLLVGRGREIAIAVDHLGRRVDRRVAKDVENERRQVLVTSSTFGGRTLRDLAPLREYGVVVSRIARFGLEFVPTGSTVIERNDQLTCVGQPEDLERFATAAGHRSSAIGATDLLSLAVGIALGVVLGRIPMGLPGAEPITLGLAGGPLVVALVLGHFGRVGGVVGHIPRPTRLLLQDLGLGLFLADAGVRGGGAFVATVQQHGVALFGLAVVVSGVPLLVGWWFARRWVGLDALQALGGICGSATSTPALGALTGRVDSQAPVVSYVAAYPMALLVMTVVARGLLGLMG